MLKTKLDFHQVHLYRPPPNSHKGQNGKLLVIGGSKLFHSSIFWSADIASRIVDIVHFTSPANENNEIIRKRIKQNFWTGIVVDWGEVESYIEEDDAILIGPGMIRDSESSENSENSESRISSENQTAGKSENPALRRSGSLTFRHSEYSEFSDRTSIIVNSLLRKYPTKKWVLDGGGLQEVEPELITQNCILTPHRGEFTSLLKRCALWVMGNSRLDSQLKTQNSQLSQRFHNATILLKGPIDIVCQGKHCTYVEAGNPGMTKGGTGDVLAGLVAALYCKNSSWTAATVGSWVNKQAGDMLYKRVGPYFNAGDLLQEIPEVMKEISS